MNAKDKKIFKQFSKSILKFLDKNGIKVKPFPEIVLDDSPQEGLFIKTGYYVPSENKIVVFTQDRHLKDCARTLTHEIIHHKQNLEGKNMNFTNEDDVKDNKELEELESEAYLKGNIYFRKWTEYERKKDDILQEGKREYLKSLLYEYRIKETIKERGINKKIFDGNYTRILEESIGKDSFDTYLPYCEIIDEALSYDEVDLESFKIKKELNPKFWKDNKLDSRIRLKLLDIADDFIEFLGIDWVKPRDITITGSLANFNWDKRYSDIDLHILIDYNKVDKRKDFVRNYFNSLKNEWNNKHDNLKIFGFPVEVYVQDSNEHHNSSGVYSIEKNEWINEPERYELTGIKLNDGFIKKEVSEYTKKIDDIEDELAKYKNDKYQLRKLSNKSQSILDDIRKKRQKSLKDSKNEITEWNYIFKCLRRYGYIDKIYELNTLIYDKMNSLP